MGTLTVKQLILLLQEMSPEAQIECELPRLGIVLGGHRYVITEAQETFYNDPDNKWVVLS